MCYLLGNSAEAEQAIKKALFQDHFNAEALAIKNKGNSDDIAHTYDKHSLWDAEFCNSVGRKHDAATSLHDEGVKAVLSGDMATAVDRFMKALAASPTHSNSHLWMGKCRLAMGDAIGAKKNMQEAIRLAHLDHEAYHKSASQEHVKRAREFLKRGELYLAINDFNKALDLDRTNQDAIKERDAANKLR